MPLVHRKLIFRLSSFEVLIYKFDIFLFCKVFVVLLIVFIVVRGIRIGIKSKDYFGFILATGISAIMGIQALINALVVTGSIPPTGLPLPLVSAGNTSLITFLFAYGVVFNVSKGG